MSFQLNNAQQMAMYDSLLSLTERERKYLNNSWAETFSKKIFPFIKEDRFSVLYSDNPASIDTPYILKMLEGWVRRRLWMCLWKQWKKIRTKYRNLIKLGLPDWAALSLANTRKAYWHIAGDSLNSALPNAYWVNLGLMSLTNRYCKIRSAL